MSTSSQAQLAAEKAPLNHDLSRADFNTIAGLVRKWSGIDLSESKLGLVKSRLQKRVRKLGLSGFSEYVEFVTSDDACDEMEELVCAISTNVTGFNREPHHFVHFREQVIPDLVAKFKRGAAVRIWSAGCSNGSEAHTIAYELLEACPDVGKYDVKILATDIDKYSLDTGRSGRYSSDMVAKIPEKSLSKWFEKVDREYQVHPDVRSLVSFKTLNLMAPWPLKMTYDVIFCRNVLIYFTQEDQERLFLKFAEQLTQSGYLYIGHSERVSGPSSSQLKPTGSTTYRRQISELAA